MADTRKKVLEQQIQEMPREMPKAGYLPGKLFLNPAIAPTVAKGAPRPFAPGEYVRNPDTSWSSEVTRTVTNPDLNGGKPTNIPSLYVVDGKPYLAKDEDEAASLAIKSGLSFPSYADIPTADKAAVDRESLWQGMSPDKASSISPLYNRPK